MKHIYNISHKLKVSAVFCMILSFSTGCQKEDDMDEVSTLVCMTQAREAWTGKECNITYTLAKEDVDDFTIDLNISLYENRKAGKQTTVDLIVNTDTIEKLKSRVDKGGVYEKYKYAVPMQDDYYTLSANQLTLNSGEKISMPVKLTIHTNKLLTNADAGDDNAFLLLPIQIKNTTAYAINQKVNSCMVMIYLPQLDKTKPDPRTPKQIVEGRNLVWNDEFNGTGALDSEKWRPEVGFRRNEELQWYQGQNAECRDGALEITGKVERVKNPNYDPNSSDWRKKREYAEYTSSSIITKDFVFSQGQMLVRAKIPTDQGAWPAIWTTGKEVNSTTGEVNSGAWEWPLGGEIDLLECYLKGGKTHVWANACWGTDTRWSAKWDSYSRPLSDFVAANARWNDEFHIWRMDWDDKYIRLYLDDELLNEINLSETRNGSGGLNDSRKGSWRNPFTDKGNDGCLLGQQIFLNLALGAGGGTPDQSKFPLKYYIDYVRIYQTQE